MQFRRSLRVAALLVTALGPGIGRGGAVQAQTAGPCRPFAQTAHAVCGTFLAYWQSHGGLAQQGYPISDEHTAVSAVDGQAYTMQVFERTVLEQHPANAPPYDVLLSPLGSARYKQKYLHGAPNQTPAAGGIWFGQTGHRIGSGFLAYWQAHGGLDQQGYPISEEFPERSDVDGKTYTVQYFERAVFEWHPENAPPYNVLLAQLGTLQSSGPPGVPAAPPLAPAPAPAGVPAAAPAPAPAPAGARPFQKGVNYAAWFSGQYASGASDQSLANLAATGANALTVVVTGYQDTIGSTEISIASPRTPTDGDLLHVIAQAHSRGLKVMLKPHVDLANDPDHWRGLIGTTFPGDTQWQAWFASYRAFIDHYAALAQQAQADLFCAGTELVGTSAREADWRGVIAGIRARFAGPLTYASNWGGDETSVRWWNALDYIGVDAYYPLTDHADPSVAELQQAWMNRGYVATLQGLAQTWQKPVILTEIGYGSVAGNNQSPFDGPVQGGLDLQEQANAYQAAFSVFWGQPWLAGMYWWDWTVDPQAGGTGDPNYTPHNKPAEQIMKSYYAGLP